MHVTFHLLLDMSPEMLHDQPFFPGIYTFYHFQHRNLLALFLMTGT